MLLYVIILFITSSFGVKMNIFRNTDIIAKEYNPTHNTRFGEFIVHFKLDCLDEMRVYKRNIIQEFLDEFKHCYKLNKDEIDEYPETVDHWIRVDKICDNDEEDTKELELDDYCIYRIEENEDIQISGGINQCVTRKVEESLWNLDQGYPAESNTTAYIEYDFSFDPNMVIIVMDSGIDISHPEFNGISYQRIFDPYPNTSLGSHGTHVTGTICGENYGVVRAKGTKIELVDVRLCDSTNTGSYPVAFNGLDAIINYLDTIYPRKAIINHSWSAPNIDGINDRLAIIRAKGGINIAAAGNNDMDAALFIPGSSNDTITVGSHQQDNTRSDWTECNCNIKKSNYGSTVDIWAPGSDILSAIPGNKTALWHGTSMATPFVSGIAVNILANNQDLDFDDIKEILLYWAINDIDDGLGNVDLPRAQISCDEYCADVGSACGMLY